MFKNSNDIAFALCPVEMPVRFNINFERGLKNQKNRRIPMKKKKLRNEREILHKQSQL